MKFKVLILSVFLMLCGFTQNSQAGVIRGFVIRGSTLNCMVQNPYRTTERIRQVQYQYFCRSPQGIPQMYFDSRFCSFDCDLEPGRTTTVTNGPFVMNCLMMSADCTAFTDTVRNY